MKTSLFLNLCFVVAVLTGCSSKKNNDKDALASSRDSIAADSVQRMQVSESKIVITYKGKEYHSTVVRHPDATLPVVLNDDGDRFADNRINLKLTCEGRTVVDKVFTKENFASMVDADFLKHSILEGLVYDKVTPQGICYAASLCYPQTDLYMPFSLTISADGKISIAKEALMDDVYEETDSVSKP